MSAEMKMPMQKEKHTVSGSAEKDTKETFDLPKCIRVLTLAPEMALAALTLLFVYRPAMFAGALDYAMALLFLTVFPLLAYPLQPLLPKFRDAGRRGQRRLAIIMAVAGYLFGILYALFAHVSRELLLVYLGYLLSGALIALFNRTFAIRASGHACGVAGPVAFLYVFFGPRALWGLVVLALVYWASLRMKRHTVSQLLWGSVLPVGAVRLAQELLLR